MKKKTKENLLKAVLLLLCLFESMIIIIIPILEAIFGKTDDLIDASKPAPEPFYSLWIISWILSGIFGIAFIVLTFFYSYDERNSKAESIDLPFDDYYSLLLCVKSYADNHSFLNIPAQSSSPSVDLSFFIKSTGLWEETCIVLVRIVDGCSDIEKIANDGITDSIMNYYGDGNITNSINVITVFCVDICEPQFRKIANRNTQQGLKNGRLAVVISFNEKKIYLARHNEGYAKLKYKKMRRLFLTILNLWK